jgi:hypothetical protein
MSLRKRLIWILCWSRLSVTNAQAWQWCADEHVIYFQNIRWKLKFCQLFAFCILKSPKHYPDSKKSSKGLKVRPRTGREGQGWEQRHNSTLSWISALKGGGWLKPRCPHCTPEKRLGSYFTGGWLGRTAGFDGCGKSGSHRNSILGPSSP